MEILPYTLRPEGQSPQIFYTQCSQLAEEILFKGSVILGNTMKDYQTWLMETQGSERVNAENLLDILIFGVLWNEHADKALKSQRIPVIFLKNLERIRSRYPSVKTGIDPLKGFLLKYINLSDNNRFMVPTRKGTLAFLRWMKATGEYNLQSERVGTWLAFTWSQDGHKEYRILNKAIEFAAFFKRRSEEVLHTYTREVNYFLLSHSEQYKYREDQFMTGRPAAEYHLNMVGGAILNRVLKDSFIQTQEKRIILPSCMKKSPHCKAIHSEEGSLCTHCTSTCLVSRITKMATWENAKVLIIPHSSGYMKTVNSLNNQSVGYVGVACVLNLLEGGFALMKKGIPAQCVYLNFSGCSRHWTKSGVVTDLYLQQLQSVMTGNSDYVHRAMARNQKTVA